MVRKLRIQAFALAVVAVVGLLWQPLVLHATDPLNRTGVDWKVVDEGPNTPPAGVRGTVPDKPTEEPPARTPASSGTVTDPGTSGFGNADADSFGGGTVEGLLLRISAIFDALIPFIIGLTVFIIIFGIFRYITESADEEKRAEAKRFILWGTIGVFCMLSVWGFVNILMGTFGVEGIIDPKDIPTVPEIQSLMK